VSVWNGCDPESGFGDKYLEQTSVCFVGKEKELDPCVHPLSRRRNSVILPRHILSRSTIVLVPTAPEPFLSTAR
jgi:hypothetical protein